MESMITLSLLLPLLSAVSLVIFSHYLSRIATGWIACISIFGSFAGFFSLLFLFDSPEVTFSLFDWIPYPGINAQALLHLDHLSLLMTLIITGIGFLIHVYANGYMDHDSNYVRFFACLNFFVFSMLLLVLAGHLLLLFVGWEGVGLASYLLIGFWYQRPKAASAAKKAFIINRIGDLGLLLGIIYCYYLFGTGEISDIASQAKTQFAIGSTTITVLSLLFFIGAVGKSAQLPLQTWLPDAMEGPTPVSALIHAATMVTAGVYLVVRMHELFLLAPLSLHIVGIIGAVTSLFAAICALGQTDLKRVLAYSTISQLGLMFLACGTAAFYTAMFHLTTHAFIKALLFLSAGNVVHMLHGTVEMGKMGGLYRIFKKTHWLFLIGVLALSGIPPLAAFFSKDLILEEADLAGFKILFYMGVLTSILTAFYLTRAYCLTFLGQPRSDTETLKHVHEAPKIMLIPVMILALLTVLGGFLGYAEGNIPALEKFLEDVGISPVELKLTTGPLFTPSTLFATLCALLGASISGYAYTRGFNRLGNTIQILKKSFYIDEIYQFLIIWPLKALSLFVVQFIEPHFFDQSIAMINQSTLSLSLQLQKVQSGLTRSYVAWMLIGAIFIIFYFVY